MTPLIVTVIQNKDLYKKYFLDNPVLQNCKLLGIDNQEENRSITKIYNEVIDSHPDQKWFIFCHDDFHIKTLPDFNLLDPTMIYGVTGVTSRFYTLNKDKFPFVMGLKNAYLGQILQGSKDGKVQYQHGLCIDVPTEVDTFDCCCIILCSDLFAKYPLRFDENLDFHLYAEDLCMQYIKVSKRRPHLAVFEAEHHSMGYTSLAYHQKVLYLASKYPTMCLINTCGSILGGGGFYLQPLIIRQLEILEQVRSWPFAIQALRLIRSVHKIYLKIVDLLHL